MIILIKKSSFLPQDLDLEKLKQRAQRFGAVSPAMSKVRKRLLTHIVILPFFKINYHHHNHVIKAFFIPK